MYIWKTLFFLLCLLREPKRNDTAEAIRMPNAQILVSDAIPQGKEPVLLREMTGSRTATGNIQDEPGASCRARE